MLLLASLFFHFAYVIEITTWCCAHGVSADRCGYGFGQALGKDFISILYLFGHLSGVAQTSATCSRGLSGGNIAHSAEIRFRLSQRPET
jgi:hypothetical protein